jgi:hypothetical protein
MMALDEELKTYQRELPRLLGREGKFALIRGNDLIGVYESYEDALQVGYDRFGLAPFLVKQIQAVEQVLTLTRGTPCPI